MDEYNRKTANATPKLRTKPISNKMIDNNDIHPVKQKRRRRTKKELLSPEEYNQWLEEKKRK